MALKKKQERRMMIKEYKDCLDLKNNIDALTSDNTLMLTPATSNLDFMVKGGIKTYQQHYNGETQSNQKNQKLFDYSEKKMGFPYGTSNNGKLILL